MRPTPTSVTPLLLVLVLALSACSFGGDEGSAPATTIAPDVVAYWAESGEGDAVAECIAELGRRSFSPDELLVAADGGSIDAETDAQLEELVESCRAAHSLDTELDPTLRIVGDEPDTFGDDRELDEWYLACRDGDGDACDQLFDEAPVGSEYEEFGLTCGNRPDVIDCSTIEDDEPEKP